MPRHPMRSFLLPSTIRSYSATAVRTTQRGGWTVGPFLIVLALDAAVIARAHSPFFASFTASLINATISAGLLLDAMPNRLPLRAAARGRLCGRAALPNALPSSGPDMARSVCNTRTRRARTRVPRPWPSAASAHHEPSACRIARRQSVIDLSVSHSRPTSGINCDKSVVVNVNHWKCASFPRTLRNCGGVGSNVTQSLSLSP